MLKDRCNSWLCRSFFVSLHTEKQIKTNKALITMTNLISKTYFNSLGYSSGLMDRCLLVYETKTLYKVELWRSVVKGWKGAPHKPICKQTFKKDNFKFNSKELVNLNGKDDFTFLFEPLSHPKYNLICTSICKCGNDMHVMHYSNLKGARKALKDLFKDSLQEFEKDKMKFEKSTDDFSIWEDGNLGNQITAVIKPYYGLSK